jgi:hypothetical protein
VNKISCLHILPLSLAILCKKVGFASVNFALPVNSTASAHTGSGAQRGVRRSGDSLQLINSLPHVQLHICNSYSVIPPSSPQRSAAATSLNLAACIKKQIQGRFGKPEPLLPCRLLALLFTASSLEYKFTIDKIQDGSKAALL